MPSRIHCESRGTPTRSRFTPPVSAATGNCPRRAAIAMMEIAGHPLRSRPLPRRHHRFRRQRAGGSQRHSGRPRQESPRGCRDHESPGAPVQAGAVDPSSGLRRKSCDVKRGTDHSVHGRFPPRSQQMCGGDRAVCPPFYVARFPTHSTSLRRLDFAAALYDNGSDQEGIYASGDFRVCDFLCFRAKRYSDGQAGIGGHVGETAGAHSRVHPGLHRHQPDRRRGDAGGASRQSGAFRGAGLALQGRKCSRCRRTRFFR